MQKCDTGWQETCNIAKKMPKEGWCLQHHKKPVNSEVQKEKGNAWRCFYNNHMMVQIPFKSNGVGVPFTK